MILRWYYGGKNTKEIEKLLDTGPEINGAVQVFNFDLLHPLQLDPLNVTSFVLSRLD